MASGEKRFTTAERVALDTTIREAEQRCRVEFSVFVGAAQGEARAFATSLHNTLVAPSRSVVIMVDPEQRLVEVVTGGVVRQELTDDEVRDVVSTMTTTFADGDLLAGLQDGINQLADFALATQP